ncbi:MAG: hypothetical protein CND83_02830 [Rhodothermaeota bacterium MED-G19]|nr:MAG: hypothetical protein CND83_02830 [Rhodothermaeota bacterium MED-G19]
MSLKYFVHVSSITNLSDARYCSGMMVNSLGFDLDENSNNKLSTENINEICAWVNGVDFVGEFNNSSSNYINDILNKINFEYISININKSIKNIDFDNKRILISIPDPKLITSKINDHLMSFFPDSRTIIIDNMNKKSISKLDILDNNYDIIINPLDNINTTKSFLDKFNLGLLLKGSQEIKPGYKDYDSISDYLEAIDESF